MGIETAMILAGGLGTRFKEYTKDLPKPMINANGVPLLVHIINFMQLLMSKRFMYLRDIKRNYIWLFQKNGTQISQEEQIYSFDSDVTVHIMMIQEMILWLVGE